MMHDMNNFSETFHNATEIQVMVRNMDDSEKACCSQDEQSCRVH